MQKLKLGLRLSLVAVFVVAILLGFASFCSFTFTKGAEVLRFTLSPWEMITGKTVDFSTEILGRSPFLGALFFIIPVLGLIGCIIPKMDVRAAVTAISAAAGGIYIFVSNYLLPDSVFYGRPLEKIFQEHMAPDSVAFGMTVPGNTMWVIYLLAIIGAAMTFIFFIREVKMTYTTEDNEEGGNFEGAVRLDNEEETAFDEIDELEPPQYEEETYYPETDALEFELELPDIQEDEMQDETDTVWEDNEPSEEIDAQATEAIPDVSEEETQVILPENIVPEYEETPEEEMEDVPVQEEHEQDNGKQDNQPEPPLQPQMEYKKLNFGQKREKKESKELPKLSFTRKDEISSQADSQEEPAQAQEESEE